MLKCNVLPSWHPTQNISLNSITVAQNKQTNNIKKKTRLPFKTVTGWATNMCCFLFGCTISLSTENRFGTKEKEVEKTVSSSDVATNSV